MAQSYTKAYLTEIENGLRTKILLCHRDGNTSEGELKKLHNTLINIRLLMKSQWDQNPHLQQVLQSAHAQLNCPHDC